MIYDFLKKLTCIRQDENSDYNDILDLWKEKDFHTALMPAIDWHSGICNLLDLKAGYAGENMIWIVPAGQAEYFWLSTLKQRIINFYENNEIDQPRSPEFPGIEAEEFEECILLHSDNLQNDPPHTILGANVILTRLSLSSGRDTLLFILLDHQDDCWEKVVEGYRIALDWFVDSGRGTEDSYARTKLYQLMKQTKYPNLLPSRYFKGLFNKGEIPEGFRFLYAMLSQPDKDGYDIWHTFSSVYSTGWGGRIE